MDNNDRIVDQIACQVKYSTEIITRFIATNEAIKTSSACPRNRVINQIIIKNCYNLINLKVNFFIKLNECARSRNNEFHRTRVASLLFAFPGENPRSDY